MPLSKWRKLSQKELFKNPWWVYRQDTFMLPKFNPFNGITNEMCRVYVARGLTHIGAKPEATEEFEHLFLKPAEIDERVGSGEIWDGMTIAAWFIGRPKIV